MSNPTQGNPTDNFLNGDTDSENKIQAITSVENPPFWPADPHLWFAQVEAQFFTKRITLRKTVFSHIVAENPCDTLKTVLIKRTAALEAKRLQQLLNSAELGDGKPSQLLRRMQQRLGDKVNTLDDYFGNFFSSAYQLTFA